MKATSLNLNHIKNNRIYLFTFIFSILFSLNASTRTNTEYDTINNGWDNERHILEKTLFTKIDEASNETIEINDIDVIELEEEVELDFDTATYLPENFNALEGKNDLDWDTIELIEIEEEVELGFDTTKYLPKGFNALEGKNDLDWSKIELIEIEEEIEINFDVKTYLPANFNPYKGMEKKEVLITSIN